MRTVAVVCPDCDGAAADYRLPPCEMCMCQGHFLTNRAPDGTMPTTWDDGRTMREWIPQIISDPPMRLGACLCCRL